MKNELSQQELSYKQLEDNFKVLKKNYDLLNKETQNLQNANSQLKNESNSLQLQMKGSEADIEKTIDKLNNFEQTVKDSIAWFKQNTNIKDEDEYNSTKIQLKECVNKKDKCRINLDCIYEVNKKEGITYIDDLAATGKDDFLKDLKLIKEQKGGDCEDFSILFNAEYNYLADYCLQNYSRDNITVFVENRKLDGSYVYVVCGWFDPGRIVTNWAGHCMVALAEYPINVTTDVYYSLKDSYLVEPQTGEYVGQMGKTDITHIFNNGVPPSTLHRIDTVITQDDLYIYYPYDQEIKWVGYHNFLQKAESLKNEVKK